MPYEVQHYTLAYGWINTWLCDEGDGLQPETFLCRKAAEAALDEHLDDLDAEYDAGQLGFYGRNEFRVRHLPETQIQPNDNQGEHP